MSRRAKRGLPGIDITPLIDVIFMLIIFFVLTTSFVQGSIAVDLPAGDPPPAAEKNPIVLSVTKDAELIWAGERIGREQIPERVAAALARSEDILVAGDKEARYGDVAELLDEMRRLGVTDVGIAFEGRGP